MNQVYLNWNQINLKMGNSKSQETVSNNLDVTKFMNNTNNTVHFNNIYNLHENHSNAIRELHTTVNIGFMFIISFILFLIVFIVMIYAFQYYKKRQKYQVQQRAQALVLNMIEKGELQKSTQQINV